MASETDLPLMSPTTEVTAAGSKLSNSATLIACRYCNRYFARVSLETGLVPLTPQEQVCARCDSFHELFKALQDKATEHTALLDRGPKHHGRKLARGQYLSAKIALENFLIAIETPRRPASGTICDAARFTNLEQHGQHVQLESKHGDSQQITDGGSAPHGFLSPMNVSTMIERKSRRRSDASNAKCKRIKFTDTAEERLQYRSIDKFNRGAKGYVPGRYVAAEGFEFLDTSGSSVSFAKFTGQRKMGSKFIDVVSREYVQGGSSVAPKSPKKEKVKEKKSHDGGTSYITKQTRSQIDNRGLRVSERSDPTCPPVITTQQKTVARHDERDKPLANSPDKSSLDGALRPAQDGATQRATGPAQIPERIGGCCQTHLDIASHDSKTNAEEVARICEIVTNIQDELSCLQQISVSSTYTDLISAAVSGVTAMLKPLATLEDIKCHHGSAVEITEDEHLGCVDTLGVTGHGLSSNMPCPVKSHVGLQVVGPGAFAATDSAELHIGTTSLAQHVHANSLNNVLEKDKLNTPGKSSLENAKAIRAMEVMSLDPSCSIIFSPLPVDETHSQSCSASTAYLSTSKYEVASISPVPYKLPSGQCALGAAGKNITSSYNHRTPLRRSSRHTLEPTLVALQAQPPRFEVAEDLRRPSHKRIKERIMEQSSCAQPESEPRKTQSSNSTGQTLGNVHVGSGETTWESKLHMTDTDRRGASTEAQVDPDAAHPPAEARTVDDSWTLPTQSRDENNMGCPLKKLDDAIEQPGVCQQGRRSNGGKTCDNTPNTGFLVDHRNNSSTTNGKDHVSHFHRSSITSNPSPQPAGAIADPSGKHAKRTTPRQSSRHIGRKVKYVYEDPLKTSDLDDMEPET